MLVLGINQDHNASASLSRNGRIIACASEERFTGVKNDVGYPRRAIDFVLTGINDIDTVAFVGTTLDPVQTKIKRITRYTIKDYIREMHEYWKPVLLDGNPSSYWEERQKEFVGEHYDFGFLNTLPADQWHEAFIEEQKSMVFRHIGVTSDKIIFVDHHTAHAYYAYFSAHIDRTIPTAVVTADGWGDGANATISIAQDNTIREVSRTAMCNMARMYRWITLILGMKPNEHEYKVMGLAPYAKDYIKKPVYDILKETLIVDGLGFKWGKEPTDMYFYFKDKFEGIRFDGIAGGLQDWVEDITAEWVTNILTELNVDQLVFGGGLSMNVKVNKVLAELPQVKDFFVSPSSGDESLCMGACYMVSPIREPLKTAYLGNV